MGTVTPCIASLYMSLAIESKPGVRQYVDLLRPGRPLLPHNAVRLPYLPKLVKFLMGFGRPVLFGALQSEIFAIAE